MNRPLRILHLVGEFRLPRFPDRDGYSGVARATLELARVQAEQGHTVTVASVGPEAWREGWRGVELRQLRRVPWARLKVAGRVLDLSAHLPYLRLSRTRRFDVLHGQMYPSLWGLRGRARVTHFHSDPHDLPATVVRRAVGSSQVQLGVSDFVTRGLRQHAPEHPGFHTVPNGVDLTQFGPQRWTQEARRLRQAWGVPPGAVVFLFAGAVVPEKGVLPLCRAFARLSERLDVHLCMAGDTKLWDLTGSAHPAGPEYREHTYDEHLAAALEGALGRGQVHRLGRVRAQDMPATYAACDVLVVPSLVSETFSLSGLEAMASGVPLIVSASGALPDLLQTGAGLSVPPGDEAAMEAAMERLATHAGERAQAGRSALAYAQALSWERAAAQVETLYRRCLEGTQRAPAALSTELPPS